MTFYLCVSGCGRYLAPRDGHERCITCLGLAHAEAAFVDESCTHCGRMTISELRSRLQLLQRGGVPVPLPRSSPHQVPPCPRPASLATSPSSSRLYRSSLRRLATSCPGGPLLHPLCRRQHLSLLVAEGDPLRLPPLPHRSNSLHPSGAVEPVVGGVPSPSRPPPRGAAKPRARGPRTGDPEMIGTALQEMVTAPLLPPEEGRVVNPLFFPSVPPLAQQPAVPKFSIKEQFLSSPGPKRARRVVGGAKPLHSHPPLLSPADSSAQFEMGTQASPAPLSGRGTR